MRILVALLPPLLLTACALGQVPAVMHPTVAGGVDIRNGEATTHWAPDHCTSGDAGYFLGFDFSSSTDQSLLRAIVEPTGEQIVRWIGPAPEQGFALHAADCSSLIVDIQPTGWRVNEVREFAGRVELKCRLPNGGEMAGQLSVDHCH